ncbi:MAG: tyrosine-type recombinase/integrase, partial [Promethearchaeota archaeon]
HLRQAGMDISELQDILGHSSPNTTRIYAKNDITKIKQVYNEKHPLTYLNLNQKEESKSKKEHEKEILN